MAVPIDRKTGDRLRPIQQRLMAARGLRAKWVDPAQFHITLKFLGEIDAGDVPRVIESVRESVAGLSSFQLVFRGVGAFPDWRSPRVVWSRVVQGAGEATEMARRVESGLQRIGFERSKRPFRPHLTLGRIKSWRPSRDVEEIVAACAHVEAGPEIVRRVTVFESRLTPKGPIYAVLEDLPLEGAS